MICAISTYEMPTRKAWKEVVEALKKLIKLDKETYGKKKDTFVMRATTGKMNRVIVMAFHDSAAAREEHNKPLIASPEFEEIWKDVSFDGVAYNIDIYEDIE